MMAEVSSSSTPTPKKSEDTDPFKSLGSLAFRIDNFREFSKLPPGETSKRHCDAEVSVRGLTFRLAVYPVRHVFNEHEHSTRECMRMGVIVKCENTSGCNVNGDSSWSCLVSVALRIKSLLKSGEDDGPYNYTHWFFFSKEKSSLEWHDTEPWYFSSLFSPKNGLYNEKDDTLELIAEISVDVPAGVMELPKTDAIQVNKQTVVINKNQLAMHSSYFHSMFYNAQFDEGKCGEYKVEIEAPATVEHFKRMLATMYPENRPLDDECIEGVLHLANRFLVTVVEGKCMEFLREESKKTALFKYRMAEKYGYKNLKDYVLDNLRVADFKDKMFKANMAEYVQLGSNAADALMARYDELFPLEPDE